MAHHQPRPSRRHPPPGGGQPSAAGGRAADRVRLTHAQTRSTIRVALGFVAAAAVAAGMGSGRWLALHLFLAGGVMLAISGVSLMLTVTWSAAPAPPGRWVATQRACIAAGTAGFAIAREAALADVAIAAAGSLYLVGLVLLAALLTSTLNARVERRFDVAAAAYLAALAAGAGGVALGIAMVLGTHTAGIRDAHVAVNVLGLVGLVVGGTMPFFAATVGRSRMAPRAGATRLACTLAWQVCALATATVALGTRQPTVAAVALTAYAAGIIAVLAALPVPTRRQLRWAGPRLIALWLGGLWWSGAVFATALDTAAGHPVLSGRWIAVLVIAGYGQILWGSLAYLLPMLRGGGPEGLGQGFAATRSWLGLIAANLTGLGLALAVPRAAAMAAAVWVLDGAWRAARVGTKPLPRPAR
jgi:nitrite reductase (NO-forming)